MRDYSPMPDRCVIPQMLKQYGGVVINISTPMVNHAFGGVPCTVAIASKGAINALTIQLATEFGKQNIRVNTISPGVIRTLMHADNADQSAHLHRLPDLGFFRHGGNSNNRVYLL